MRTMTQSQTLDGYPKLAAFMAGSPGVAIFRGFSELNIQNLLYLQSEISHLVDDYQETAQDDYESEDTRRANFSKEWIKLAKSSGSASKQWRQWVKIRSKLAQYSQTDQRRWYIMFAYISHIRPRTHADKPFVAAPKASQAAGGSLAKMAQEPVGREKLSSQCQY